MITMLAVTVVVATMTTVDRVSAGLDFNFKNENNLSSHQITSSVATTEIAMASSSGVCERPSVVMEARKLVSHWHVMSLATD